jgi:hypothetical protein
MSREALHLHFGGTNALEAFAALLLCERPTEPSDEALRLARSAAEVARDRSRGKSGTRPLPVLIPGDLGPFRALYALAREQAKTARSVTDKPEHETRPAAALRLLLSLRHRQRAAVGLRYLIGMPRDAVGLVMGLPPRSVDQVLLAGINAVARGSRSKIDVRRNLRTAGAGFGWTRNRGVEQAQAPPQPTRRTEPRSVVRLLLAPSPFGLDAPLPDDGIFDVEPPLQVVGLPRPIYDRALPERMPVARPARTPVSKREWLSRVGAVAAAVIAVAIVAVWPRAVQVPRVPLAVVPLAPAVSAPAPRVQAGPIAAMYSVRSGDTLWSIASRALGDPYRWQELWRANAGKRMADGARFVDPDLIKPGWQLAVPRARQRAGPG